MLDSLQINSEYTEIRRRFKDVHEITICYGRLCLYTGTQTNVNYQLCMFAEKQLKQKLH